MQYSWDVATSLVDLVGIRCNLYRYANCVSTLLSRVKPKYLPISDYVGLVMCIF